MNYLQTLEMQNFILREKEEKPIQKIFRDYEPEQAYGTSHDFREHTRFGGTREDY